MPVPPQVEELLRKLREAGLYEDQVTIPPSEEDGPKLIILTMFVGDRAFSKKVQDPEEADWDQSFREIARGFLSDSFEDARKQLLEGLGEGDS